MKTILTIISCMPMLIYSFSKRPIKNLDQIFQNITTLNWTLVTKERFQTIDNLSKIIKQESIDGDVVECGVWRGGMSIYMAYAFRDKDVWVCDSFQGFETLDQCKYDPRKINLIERHKDGIWIAGLEEVKNNFKAMNLDESNGIHFLPGWVNITTDISTCPIQKIALLRIDVDAYSATLVTLENLYDKVVPGGFIIFDDSGLYETIEAIKEFEKKRNLNIISKLQDPLGNHVGRITGEHGLYFRK